MKQPPCMMSSSEVIEIWKVSMPLGITIFEQVTGFDFFHILAMMASRIPHERLLGRITPAGSRPIPCERLFSQFPPEDSRLIPTKRLSTQFSPEDSRLIPPHKISMPRCWHILKSIDCEKFCTLMKVCYIRKR